MRLHGSWMTCWPAHQPRTWDRPITVVFQRFTTGTFGGDTVRVVYVSAESKETMPSVMSQLTNLLYELLETDSMSPGFSLRMYRCPGLHQRARTLYKASDQCAKQEKTSLRRRYW
jgi:hypothetical protein